MPGLTRGCRQPSQNEWPEFFLNVVLNPEWNGHA